MSINLICPQCFKTQAVNTATCKCGNNLRKNKRYKVRVKLPTGQWKTKTCPSLESARKVEAKFKTQAVEEGVFTINRAPLAADVWSRYLDWAKLNKRTWNDDKVRWEIHVESYVRSLKLDQVTPQLVQTIINDISTKTKANGKPYAPATVKQVFVLLKRVINWSRKQGLYRGSNPCTSISIPKFDNRITNPLDTTGLQSLLHALDTWSNERAVLVVRFALYSGKRRGEILKLQWSDIDLENRLITFRATNTKSKKTQVLPINNSCRLVIERCKELQSGCMKCNR